MTFIVCSKKPDQQTASISFSGNNLEKFGFSADCKVAVDISKGRIVITSLEGASRESTDNSCVERG
jgi:hypothetical protein